MYIFLFHKKKHLIRHGNCILINKTKKLKKILQQICNQLKRLLPPNPTKNIAHIHHITHTHSILWTIYIHTSKYIGRNKYKSYNKKKNKHYLLKIFDVHCKILDVYFCVTQYECVWIVHKNKFILIFICNCAFKLNNFFLHFIFIHFPIRTCGLLACISVALDARRHLNIAIATTTKKKLKLFINTKSLIYIYNILYLWIKRISLKWTEETNIEIAMKMHPSRTISLQ